MSESQENQSLNLWNNDNLWSGVDAWYPPPHHVSVSLSDVGGVSGTGGCDKSEAKPVNSPLPNWSPISLLHVVEKPSIWSAGELCPSDTTNLCLSDHTSQWSLSSPLPTPLDGNWDAPKDPIPLDFPTANLPNQSWKSNQVVHVQSEATKLSTSNCPITVSDSSYTDFVPKDCKTLAVYEADDTSKCDQPGVSDEAAALSTEQLCDHLINSHDGWGSRPVNQIVPWDTSSLVKLNSDQPGRSGIATPTPGASSTTSVGTAYRLPSTHCMESNSWNNEPLNGTAIWEKQYDRFGDNFGVWSSSACDDSSNAVDSTCTTGSMHGTATPLMVVNNIGPTQSGRLNTAAVTQPSFQRSTTSFRDWDSDKLWMPDGNATSGMMGRPLLGGMRCASNQVDEGLSTWCNSDASTLPNNNFESASNNPSWINAQTHPPPSGGVAAAIQWNANNTSIASTFTPSISSLMTTPSVDEVKRRHGNLLNSVSTMQPNAERMVAHTSSSTYRADLVKLLTSQGFRKEDAHAALISCNMEPERALLELRERYRQSGSHNPCYGLVTPPPSNAQSLQQQNPIPNNSCSLGQLPGSPVFPATGSNINGPGAFPTGRGKQTNSSTNQSINMVQHPNQQLVRQQFMQQMRSAFTLSLPGASNSSSATTAGNSLLGQPPPTLNGVNPSSGSHTHQSNGNNHNGNCNLGPLLNRGPNAPPPAVTPLISVSSHNSTKRSPRQTAIISAIQELQKKHQSIQHQIHTYKNNPTMRAQPQYADVFAELQGQMQQIEAQVKAKQAQLNLVCSQDTAAGFRGQQQQPQSTSQSPLDHSLPHGNGIQTQRFTQDQLVQQLTDLRLRANNNANYNDQGDSEFSNFGMWTPQNKSGGDMPEKHFDHSTGPRSLVGSRGGSGGSRSQQQQSSLGWQTAGSWSNQTGGSNSSNHVGQQQQQLNSQQQQRYANMAMQWSQGGCTGANQFNQHQMNGGSVANCNNNGSSNQQSMSIGNFGGVGTGAIQPQNVNPGFGNALDQSMSAMGQWVLIQPLAGNPPPKLSVLHNLLATQYGLTNLHVVNQNSACVLARLQSKDSAFQLMRSLNSRLSIDALQESEVIAYLQRTNSRGEIGSSGFSPSSELSISSGTTGNNWLCTADSTSLPSSNAAAAGFFPRRSSAQNNQRFGTVASGLH